MVQTRVPPMLGQPPDRPFWPLRWWELLPEVVVGLGLTIFLVDQTDAATSAFKSGRAVLIMAAGGLLWILARLAAARFVPWAALRMVPFALGGLLVLAVVVLPGYRNETVVETFPGGARGGPAPTTSPTSPSGTSPSGTSPSGTSPSGTRPPATGAPATTTPAGPTVVRTSTFRGIDHRASGTVNLYRTPEGRFVVGLEDIDIQPGPDYDVYVVPGPNRQDRSGATRLDDLRGNRGTQFYEIPAGVDVGSGPWTVLIWCQTFAVPIANATPA